jgi:hypothetical protein
VVTVEGVASNGVNFPVPPANITISGYVKVGSAGVSGVPVLLRGTQPDNTTTDATGLYSFTVQAGGNYTVQPQAEDIRYTFIPLSTTYMTLASSVTQDFTATRTYILVGQITIGSTGISGVNVSLSGSQSGSSTTDANGWYGFFVGGGGSYTVTPSGGKFTFTPSTLDFPNVTATQNAPSVTATATCQDQ